MQDIIHDIKVIEQLEFLEHEPDISNAKITPSRVAKFIDPDVAYLNPYFHESMDQMLAYLNHGTPIAPSQVIRTTPGPIGPAMFGPVQEAPGTADAITWAIDTLTIPD